MLVKKIHLGGTRNVAVTFFEKKTAQNCLKMAYFGLISTELFLNRFSFIFTIISKTVCITNDNEKVRVSARITIS